MAVHPTFLELIDGVKRETGHSTYVSPSPDYEEKIKYVINKHYKMLAQLNWPDLRKRILFTIKNGQTLYSDLGEIEEDNIKFVHVRDATLTYSIRRGIYESDYSYPVVHPGEFRYDWVADKNDLVMEVFPTPEEDMEWIFEIQIPYKKLVNLDDICYLDELTVVLAAAAELKADSGQDPSLTLSQLSTYVQDRKSNIGSTGDISNGLNHGFYGDDIYEAIVRNSREY